MWVFIPEGFFSLVQDKKDDSIILVRSRYPGDLENLLNAYDPDFAPVHIKRITEWSGTDYRYRLPMERVWVETVFGQAAGNIRYTNFKNEVTNKQGHTRHDLYMKVWSILVNAQDRNADVWFARK
jgi:hypothetical protein